MLIIAYYFLQVVLCNGIMMGYYLLVLRNKRFHQYNRFYLLFAAIVSWLIPLVKINVAKPIEQPQPIFNLVNIVADNNSEIENIVVQKAFAINWDAVVVSLYICICVVFLVSILAALYRIYSLLKKHSCKSVDDVYLILTNAKGTPFSFFKYIFWNNEVDMNTPTGKQMMQHELTHVREHHSVDKIFIQVVMMFGWFNPFFWVLKKELHLIHEFIADNKTIKDGDGSALAEMLLAAAYPQQNFLLTNPFFFSHIKRRLLMLTNTKNTKLSYARRVIALPLLAVIVMLFAFRNKDEVKNTATLSKVYTVVIDAGHGGTDAGAVGIDGSNEKDLSLLMLKAIKENNKNENIRLVFTREADVFQSPIEKAKFVNDNKADLFISLHMNWASKQESSKNGVEIFVPIDDAKRSNVEESKMFGGLIEQSLLKSFKSNGVKSRKEGVWILKATTCPAALIECGFISNEKDLALLKNKAKQNEMASLILEGVENYLANMDGKGEKINSQLSTDTIIGKAKRKGNVFAVDSNGNKKYFNDSVILVADTKKKSIYPVVLVADTFSTDKRIDKMVDFRNFLILIDGNRTKYEDINKVAPPDTYQSVRIIRKKEDLAIYGEEGKHGVIMIITKKKVAQSSTALNMAFSNNHLMTTAKVEDQILIELIGKRNELIIKDKHANADKIQFLNDKIIERVNEVKTGKQIVTNLVGSQNNLQAELGSIFPLNNGYVKQRFGSQKIGHFESYSDGITICSKTDNQVKSITVGTVSFIGTIGGDLIVIVRNKDGYTTTYTGLKDIKVQRGQTVAKGSSIGSAINNGNENEMMLLITDKNGKFINPINLVASR